jgi:hypothetical protein
MSMHIKDDICGVGTGKGSFGCETTGPHMSMHIDICGVATGKGSFGCETTGCVATGLIICPASGSEAAGKAGALKN